MKGDYQRADESDLILEGYIAFLDPPKETTAPALKALKASGITVKILTGDSELVAAKVCHEVGLDAGEVVIGSDIETLSDDELANLAQRTTLFARLTPMHKERIVTLLKREGHVVGFMGDGINDAPALRAADIGISVDGAVDIAREAADIILLEKSLMVLEEGVIEGRRTFANMLKYIKMTASSNFGNVFSVLVASAFSCPSCRCCRYTCLFRTCCMMCHRWRSRLITSTTSKFKSRSVGTRRIWGAL